MGTSYGYDHVQMLGAETQETCHGALQTGSRSCDLDWMIHWLHVVKIMESPKEITSYHINVWFISLNGRIDSGFGGTQYTSVPLYGGVRGCTWYVLKTGPSAYEELNGSEWYHILVCE